MTTKLKIPKIRFKEFSWEWENWKIEDNFQVRMCKRIFNSDTTINWEIPFYKIWTIWKQADSYISRKLFEEYKSKYNYPKKWQLMITCSWTVWRTIVFDWKDSYFQDSNIVWLDNQKSEINNNFIYYIISNYDWWKLNATTITRIYNDDLRKLKISSPSLPEQQKIASFLSSVDEKIEKIKEKKKNLQDYKKWVMQGIFNQEIRFKSENWEEFGEWEEINFNKIIEKIGTWLNPRKNFVLWKWNNYYVTIKNISNGKLDFSSCEKIDDIALQKIHNRSQIQKNDLIMSSIGNIWESFLIESTTYNWDINESVFMIRWNNKVLPKFLYYIVTNNISKKYFDNNSTGSSFKSIKLNSLKIMPINLPTLKEQEKIADFLSGIDEKIEKVSDELGKMEEFKKGLLQGMFV